MKMKNLKEAIDNSLKNRFQKFYLHPEYNACITHWLHNPAIMQPFMDEQIFNECINIFNNFLSKTNIKSKLSTADDFSIYQPMFLFKDSIPFPPPEKPKFTFIDLFAGIGGFRIALQELGGQCVFSSEWDKYAQKTYEANFGEVPYGDIRQISEKIIPNHELLCAGFPCQAFSIAGRRLGFNETRGTLFFEIARIIKEKQPKAFFLENVKGLRNHKRGQTLETILNVLRNDLEYYVPSPEIINAKNFGVPQNRERIFIIGFRKDIDAKNFMYPKPLKNIRISFSDIKEKEIVSSKYYLSNQYLKTLKAHKSRHVAKGNGFGYEIIKDNGIANAIVVGGMGRERNLVIDKRLKDFTPVTKIIGEINREGIRRMTPGEWAKLQGFPYPEKFKIVVADTQAYKQFGNSVAIPAIKATANSVIQILERKNYNER